MRQYLLTAACAVYSINLWAQQDGTSDEDARAMSLTGSIQSDVLLPQRDSDIGAQASGDVLTNTYVDLQFHSRYLDAGGRFEYLKHPLPGYENDFSGSGVPNFWVRGAWSKADVTLGTFYEQFGSGFILRSYEERSLGIDNSLLGGRLVLRPGGGLTIKALSGRQRRYWKWDTGVVSGADAEWALDECLTRLQESETRLTLGASWVNKYEKDEVVFADPTHRYNFPKYVNAWDARARLDYGAWSVLAEYAHKGQDPSFDNQYSYDDGHVAMLSASYSESGLSLLLQAKRSDNMSFRSQRSRHGSSTFINHLPAFTLDQTYALAALYPYATQLTSGEWAYQAEVGYNFKRRTSLGGRYGMNLKVNYSYVRSIQAGWLEWGKETYYQDFDIQLSRRVTKDFKLNLMYMNQHYNKSVVEGEGGMVRSNIYIADGMYQLAPKTKLRAELQYLSTRDDQGDWAFGLVELSMAPHWMVTVSDMWNVGDSDMTYHTENTHLHYYLAQLTYNVGSHRIQAGYGRTRAGFNCSGGVCRYVPATKGFTLSYNYNF